MSKVVWPWHRRCSFHNLVPDSRQIVSWVIYLFSNPGHLVNSSFSGINMAPPCPTEDQQVANICWYLIERVLERWAGVSYKNTAMYLMGLLIDQVMSESTQLIGQLASQSVKFHTRVEAVIRQWTFWHFTSPTPPFLCLFSFFIMRALSSLKKWQPSSQIIPCLHPGKLVFRCKFILTF